MRRLGAAILGLALTSALFVPNAVATKTYEITVVFKGGTSPEAAAAIVESAGGSIISSLPAIGMMEISGPASILKTLNQNKAVEAATPTITFNLKPLQEVELSQADLEGVNPGAADLYQAYSWDIKQLTNDGASFDLSTGSHNTVVGIIDTGINTQHSDLAANLLGGRNFVNDGPGGTVDPADIEDRRGHGSHVAGSIAGNGRILGVGPDLGYKAYRVFGAAGGSSSSRIIEAILYAADDGVDVISMSLGGFDVMGQGFWTDPETGETERFKDVASMVAYKRAIQYAVNKGIVVVAAAGNDAIDISKPKEMTAFLNVEYGPEGYYFQGASKETPGSLPGVIGVSATGPDLSLASYSNFGNGVIDVAAPGGDFQRYPEPGWHFDMCVSATSALGGNVDRYSFSAGTSMATPKVAAIAALIIDQAKAQGQRITPVQVEHTLIKSATDLGKPGQDPQYGQGMVNAYNALGGR